MDRNFCDKFAVVGWSMLTGAWPQVTVRTLQVEAARLAIAMLHAELGAAGQGVLGRWELLDGPYVAGFSPAL